LVYFLFISYIFCSFGLFSVHLVHRVKKNLATLAVHCNATASHPLLR
jgi:hypothetical protein